PFGGIDDGTITPHAIAGGVVFTPENTLRALKYLHDNYESKIWGEYGFTDAVNVKTGWAANIYLGIDEGPVVLMIENFRTGLIWKYFMQNRYIQEGMKKIGFMGIIENFETDRTGETYSKYSVDKKSAELKINSDIFADGKRSLEITPLSNKDIVFLMEPGLKKFGCFGYISLWARNAKEIVVKLSDKGGREAALKPCKILDSAGWKRCFYSLKDAVDIDMENIKEVSCIITQPESGTVNTIYLDGIFLAYDVPESNPEPVKDLKVSAMEDSAVLKASFIKSGDAFLYDIRYSQSPINGQKEFEKLKPAEGFFFASVDKSLEEFFIPQEKKGDYWVSVQVIDRRGQRSEPVSAGPVTLKSASFLKPIDDFERRKLSSDSAKWSASSELIDLKIEDEKSAHGNASLKVKYNKKSGYEWEYVEVSFNKPLNVKPFRYLKIKVYGKEVIIAKLYNNEEMQEDIASLAASEKDKWNELAFDMQAVSAAKIDKKRINKILFFIAPGQVKSGVIYFDDITLSNKR
ncbi:MAG: glucoamylase family protein, partial [Candidatus Auribacterota bacterium]|nr:glucoamylase family protein [Candidatus Auribacterota bacterium]